MREIQLKDVKAKLSAVVDDAVRGDEFVITRHGHKQAVVVFLRGMEATVERPELRSLAGGGAARRRGPSETRRRASAGRRPLRFLVDTNIISALAPTKAERPAALVEWLDRRSDDLFVSVVTAAEIRAEIAKAAGEGAKRKGGALTPGGMRSSTSTATASCRSISRPPPSQASCRIAPRRQGAPRIRRHRDRGHRRGERAHCAHEKLARLRRDLRSGNRSVRDPAGIEAADCSAPYSAALFAFDPFRASTGLR